MGGTYWSDGVPVCGPPDAGRYRSLWPVSSDTGLYRAVTVEIPIVTARYGRNSDCYRPFIIVVNLFTSICVFVTAIALYYFTRQESYLYTPFSGFHGVLSGFLVGIKQILPDQELSLFVLKIKAKVYICLCNLSGLGICSS
ncbi:hypothetical protein BHE74_00024276 [Ensete ventricosum]|nr:hypothetical protein BHE74_00024276 [Ensete ventricosum]